MIQTTTTTADETTTDSTTDGTPSGSGSVQGLSRAQAGEIAVAEVGGTVNRVYKEDDFGAAWEVEVATPDGEFDVYVSAAGEVVRTRGPKPD